jgi:hypothetical protein
MSLARREFRPKDTPKHVENFATVSGAIGGTTGTGRRESGADIAKLNGRRNGGEPP